jgi:hypothetical protein
MNLELRGIENVGDIGRERVVLRATGDADIGKFAIFKCRKTSNGGAASGHVPAAYWFPDKLIKSGDWVVLYTKQGTSSEKSNEPGTQKTYFYYWGFSEPQWKTDVAALVSTPNWTFSKSAK